ncbi:MAG: hypothetical protein UMR38_07220 [Candidatus Izemoplasma sp.]|nr:hypothetical protein [Candidatus Izemoplasma sp.]
MKKVSKLYYVLTYIFFLYPPFIWGIVSIYSSSITRSDHIITLILNLILLLALALGIALAIYLDKIHVPSKIEQKYLLFGLIGNILMYFYTFQNALELSNLITVYLLLILVLGVHSLLISRSIKPLELWILLPLFIVIDYIHLAITGCGWTDYNCSSVGEGGQTVALILYLVMIFSIFVYYIKQLIQYQLLDILKLLHLLMGITVVVLFQNIQNLSTNTERFLMTLLIALAFLLIVDFIISIVNKTYTHKMTLFYIRTLTLIGLGIMIGTMELFTDPRPQKEILAIMVAVTYISLSINILKTLLNVKVTDTLKFRPTSYTQKYRLTEELISDIHQVTLLKDDVEVGLYGYEIRDIPMQDKTQVNILSFDLPNDNTDQDYMLDKMISELTKKGDSILFESIKFDPTLDTLLIYKGFVMIFHQKTHLVSYILET